jgi:hypothetical protein
MTNHPPPKSSRDDRSAMEIKTMMSAVMMNGLDCLFESEKIRTKARLWQGLIATGLQINRSRQ